MTSLHLAAWNGHGDILMYLLEGGADVNAHDRIGRTALHWAAEHGHRDVVALLLSHMDLGQIAAKDNEEKTALHWAAGNGHRDVVALLERPLRRRIPGNSE